MKIRNKFRILIICISLVPVMFFFSKYTYHYYISPERALTGKIEHLNEISDLNLTEKDKKTLKDLIRISPTELKIAIIAENGSVLASTLGQIESGKIFSKEQVHSLLDEKDKDYFYQFTNIPCERTSEHLLCINRIPRKHMCMKPRAIKPQPLIALCFIIFEAVCILISMSISRTVSKSINILQENTKRITEGHLDTVLINAGEKQNDNEITMLTENLEKMRESLKENQCQKDCFIMGISHDLRTPVSVIKGYTEAISDGVITGDEKIKDALLIITKKTEQLSSMIDTLLDFMKLKSTDWRQNLTEHSLNAVIENFTNHSKITAEIFKRNVTTDIRLDTEIMIPLDKQLTERMLENLFSNAIRYSNENDEIEIRAVQETENVKLYIKDNGIGISREDKEHIFDLFYRASPSRRECGMGIGLTVVKNIIEVHGWKIEVHSEEGAGTEFIITIPY